MLCVGVLLAYCCRISLVIRVRYQLSARAPLASIYRKETFMTYAHAREWCTSSITTMW